MPRLETIPTLKQLRAFMTVVESGSALGAAARLRVSQPAVSYSLSKLENGLGVRLLERNASGSFPTPAGRLLYPRSTRLFALAAEAVRHVVTSSGGGQDRYEVLARKLRETEVRALISIWRAGSFRAAARDLRVSEPSLQRPARELERLLRASLYRRTQTGMEVNPTGAELARRFSLALDEIRCAVEEMGAAIPRSSASLNVGVLALTPRMIVADAAIKLLAGYPQQRIDIVEASYETQLKALRSGDIDVIFGALRMPPPYDDITEESLFEDPYVLACSASHPLARARNVSPRQLARYDFVFPSQGLPRRAEFERMLHEWSISPKGRVETSCLATIVALLNRSERISMLSRWHVDGVASNGLSSIDVKAVGQPQRIVGITVRSQWWPTPFQKQFLQLLRQSIQVARRKRRLSEIAYAP